MTNNLEVGLYSQGIPIGIIRHHLELPDGWKIEAVIKTADPENEFGENGTIEETLFPVVVVIDPAGRQRAARMIYDNEITVAELISKLALAVISSELLEVKR